MAFKAHIWRIPTKEGDATFRFRINYMLDPSALHLPANYQISYMRHLSLRAAFLKLEPEALGEFTARLSKGLKLRYWEVVSEEEALRLRRPPGPGVSVGHYLPANLVLKTQGSTQTPLVLDAIGLLNQNLLKAPNLEQKT